MWTLFRPSVAKVQQQASSGKTPAEFRFQVTSRRGCLYYGFRGRISSVLNERKPALVRLNRPGSVACFSLLSTASTAKHGSCREKDCCPGGTGTNWMSPGGSRHVHI